VDIAKHEKSCWCVCQPGVHPGECWAFNGSEGYLVVQLSAPIVVTEVAIEHIPVSLASSGNINSAPRDFTVWVSCSAYVSSITSFFSSVANFLFRSSS